MLLFLLLLSAIKYVRYKENGTKYYPMGAVHKRRRNFFGRFRYPPPPCQNFDPDLPNFYFLISCNIGIWDHPPPLKYADVFYGWPHRRTLGSAEKSNDHEFLSYHRASLAFLLTCRRLRKWGEFHGEFWNSTHEIHMWSLATATENS